MLWKVGMLVLCGALVIVTRHLYSFLPSLVTKENDPPLSMYHCIFWLTSAIVSAAVYCELSSHYDRRCMLGVFAVCVLCLCIW